MPAATRKFGTFGGVFTPAILTILGVIMYMRLPWIVGQGGLFATLGIIVVAHLISVTTGLSVSSIATDKRVDAGGSYYIISRSLGLALGGTLGIALFLGLSFSVSLYLIGFAESYLTATGYLLTPDAIRLTGAIALVVVTAVTFISTALAIKTQYFIMAAIALSVGSIIIGALTGPGPPAPHLHAAAAATAVPLATLFAIFFPAVTGFEAGVSMSGDLADPRRSIPSGTLAAIGVGLLVYLGLAVLFAYRVPATALADDPGVLLTVSAWPPLVTAGVFGATISSALGSILGAPRILQACSLDGITPRLFARGAGPANEPRRAVLVTFVIALAGILIGELDAIARVVSMFFIMTYGFLNLSCALESWASTDFRPDFRIPRWVSLLGAATCFITMIQLDVLAMLLATVAMVGGFVWLKRRQLTLDEGDTWDGIWASVARASLAKLAARTRHARNWRPSLLTFSPDSPTPDTAAARLGALIAETRGIHTDFTLVPAEHPAPHTARDARRLETRAPLDTVRAIARYHGGGALTPNTAFIDAAFLPADPLTTERLLADLAALGLNIGLASTRAPARLDRPRAIALWTRESTADLAFGMALLRELTARPAWRHAAVHVTVLTDDGAQLRALEQRLRVWLAQLRIEADLQVLHSPRAEAFGRPVADTAAHADLHLIGLAHAGEADARLDVTRIAGIARHLDNVLFIEAATADFTAPVPRQTRVRTRPDTLTDGPLPAFPRTVPIALPEDVTLRAAVRDIERRLTGALARFHLEHIVAVRDLARPATAETEALGERTFERLEQALATERPDRRRKAIARLRSDVRNRTERLLDRLESELVADQRAALEVGLTGLDLGLAELASSADSRVAASLNELRRGPGLGARLTVARSRVVAALTGRPATVRVRVAERIPISLEPTVRGAVAEVVELVGGRRAGTLSGIERLLGRAAWAIELAGDDGRAESRAEALAELRARFKDDLAALRQHEDDCMNACRDALIQGATDALQQLIMAADQVAGARRPGGVAKARRESARQTLRARAALLRDAERQSRLVEHIRLDQNLRAFHHRLQAAVARARQTMRQAVRTRALGELESLRAHLHATVEGAAEPRPRGPAVSAAVALDDDAVIATLRDETARALAELPEVAHPLPRDGSDGVAVAQATEIELRRLVELVLETQLAAPIEGALRTLRATVTRAARTAHDVASLTGGLGTDLEAAHGDEADEDLRELHVEALERVDAEAEAVSDALREADATFDRLEAAVIERTRVESLTGAPEEIERFVRQKESELARSRAARAVARIKRGMRQGLARLVYERSRGLLLARRLTRPDGESGAVERVLRLASACEPDPEVEQNLSVHYSQLFSGGHAAYRAYRVSRDAEMAAADAAVARREAGRGGAIVVTGPLRSGTTSLALAILERHADKARTLRIAAPEAGTPAPEELYAAIGRATGQRVDPSGVDAALAALPPGTALYFHDAELWWERAPGGLAAIDALARIIDRHGARLLIVVVINTHALRLLRRLGRLEREALATLVAGPFDALALRRAIMARHDSSGLELRFAGVDLRPGEWRLARAFSNLFDLTDGAVGAALDAWLAHLTAVDERSVTLRAPTMPDLAPLDALDPALTGILVELVLHRRLDDSRLARITGLGPGPLAAAIAALVRSGVATRTRRGSLEPSRYLRPHLERWLTDRGVL